jgi:hypothetical protein
MATAKPYEPKVGHKVTATTRYGKTYTGRVDEINQRTTGAYYAVNVGDKKNPLVKSFRASELARA